MSASNAIPYDTYVSNFVSVKLSGKHNYRFWKAQMLCLLNSINIHGILDDTFVGPRDSGPDIVRQYDNLVKGWIFGSVSEVVLEEIYDLNSTKDVWVTLQSNYDVTMNLQKDSTPKESDAKTEKEDIDDVAAERNTFAVDVVTASSPTEMETENKDTQYIERNKKIKSLIVNGNWRELESMLKENTSLATEAITNDGSTILHIAVGLRQNSIVERLCNTLNEDQLSKTRDSDGSTALHIAANVGNEEAVKMMMTRNMLYVQDKNGVYPLNKAFQNMHIGAFVPMYRHWFLDFPKNDLLDVLLNAISAKEYDLAVEFYRTDFELDMRRVRQSRGGEILMAIAKSFPSELGDGEKLIYPSVKNSLEMLRETALALVYLFVFPATCLYQIVTSICADWQYLRATDIPMMLLVTVVVEIFSVPISMLLSAFVFIFFLMLMVCFPFLLLYSLWWKGAKMIAFPPIMKIENKIEKQNSAKELLGMVCDGIGEFKNSEPGHRYYKEPILEATCHNAYTVVDEILSRSPESIESKDKNGHDIIQLAIMNRSEKIYNLIYDVDERKNLHKRYIDSSSGNNILHLAGRLAPSRVLNQRTGAALQLQRELQWREEVKKLVIPTYLTQENYCKETPDMVFTNEHKNLVKDGEQWMKTTSESCSITAALIITIVFAAAITVPGGSNQETGTPLFKKKIAFIIFAISDAISLFASSTSLLVFLSILTARFSEQDFLFSLPWRLFIGLFSLLLSTTTMMIAFSATLFLVFCDKNLWMLALICGLALTPISFFVGLQFPLMVDLFNSTYLPIFGKERNPKKLIRKMYNYVDIF